MAFGISSLRGLLTAILIVLGSLSDAPAGATTADDVQTSWRMLDYIAVDYPGAVANGKVINAAEFQEMNEFSASVAKKLAALPPTAARDGLIAQSAALQKAISAKSPPPAVAAAARRLGGALLAAYPVPLAPKSAPDTARGAALFADNCASCHGAKGEGPSGAFARLDPPPIAFTDRDRARERSVFGLYQVISQGLEGTAMQSFAALPDEDRWALAFHAGGIAWPDVEAGRRLWAADPTLRALVPNMAALVALTPAALEQRIGKDKADAVIAFLRANPQAVAAAEPGSLSLARSKLHESLAAYAAGNRDQAGDLALSAYLDGFEPVEAVLATRDGSLMAEVEKAMAGFRTDISRGVPVAALQGRLATTELLLDQAETALAPEAATDISTFLGAAIFVLLETWITTYTEHWMLFLGIVLAVLVIFFRRGIFGTILDRFSRKR